MFVYLESREEVQRAQQALMRTIRRAFRTSVRRGIGFPGGNVEQALVNTDGRYWYRTADFSSSDIPNPRRLNWFGLYDEDATYFLSISVEINIAYEGRNENVAGFFGRDSETGAVYLFHSGRVGGGTKGVSKSAFLALSNRRPEAVVATSGDRRYGLLVMPVEGQAATRSLARYIEQVAEFKNAVRRGALKSREYKERKTALDEFYAEARGRRLGRRRSTRIDYLSRHGEVVDALYTWRKRRGLPQGARIVKNAHIDMGVGKGGGLLELYEVKTSATRDDAHAAVGQLMIHGVPATCRKIVVLPSAEFLAPALREAFDRLGIELLRYTLDESRAIIEKRSA